MPKVTTFRHLYERVDYPRERGYRMEPFSVPPWMHLEIHTHEDSHTKRLFVCSRIHMNKAVKVGPDYSSDFTDMQILREQSAEVWRLFIRT